MLEKMATAFALKRIGHQSAKMEVSQFIVWFLMTFNRKLAAMVMIGEKRHYEKCVAEIF